MTRFRLDRQSCIQRKGLKPSFLIAKLSIIPNFPSEICEERGRCIQSDATHGLDRQPDRPWSMEKGVDQISHFSESLALFLDRCSGHADRRTPKKM
jgi:hypothetical protein